MSKRSLIIVGTGLFAEVACAYFDEYSDYQVIAYACHRAYLKNPKVYDLPLHALEDLTSAFPPEDVDVFVAIGYGQMNRVRQRVYEEVVGLGYTCASFVHPQVKIWNSTTLGRNVFIFEDNTIQPFTSIGPNTILWSGNHIGHHSNIGAHCFISSHVVISGSCDIGDRVFIGVNATLRDSIKISDETLIGAGALIMRSTKVKEVCVADRTRPHKLNSDEVGF